MKRVKVRATPKAKQNKVVEEERHYKVYVTAPAEDGRANRAVMEFLAEHFGTKKLQIRIVHGEKSRDKIVELR